MITFIFTYKCEGVKQTLQSNISAYPKTYGEMKANWKLLRSRREDSHDVDINTMVEHHSKLWVALNVLHECFQPCIEPRTEADFFTNVVFNRG
ncbi:hypothetical protein ACLOJK_018449 [Asimina triloba]